MTLFYCLACGKPIHVAGELPARCPACAASGLFATDRPDEPLTAWDRAFLRVNRILVSA